jgi:hypothetical protein
MMAAEVSTGWPGTRRPLLQTQDQGRRLVVYSTDPLLALSQDTWTNRAIEGTPEPLRMNTM